MMPEKIGRYEIKTQIGRGGMGTVYQAHDPLFKRDVALKVISAQVSGHEKTRLRFIREAETFASLEHAAIVPVYDFGDQDDQLYLAIRLMTGGTLAERLQRDALTVPEANNVIKRLSSALNMTHQKGIIHRDLKPENILFDEEDKAYLTDFGIAKIADTTSDLTGEAYLGTWAYMSPEQFDNKRTVDNRADIYALGAILFEMLTGQRPFKADTPPEWVNAHISEPVPFIHDIRTGLPLGCEAVVEKAMAKAPEDRFDSVVQMAEALEKMVEEDTGKQQSIQLLASSKMSETAETATAPQLEKPPLIQQAILKWWPWLLAGVIAVALLLIPFIRPIIFPPTPTLTTTPSPSATPSPSPTQTPVVPTIINTPLPTIEGSLVVVFYDAASAIVQIGDGAIQRIPASGQIPLPTSGESVVLQSNAGSIELLLPDKTRLFLDLNTSIRVEQVRGVNEAESTLIFLEQGRVALSNPTEKVWVGGPLAVTAAMNVGMVAVSQNGRQVDIDCINGRCSLAVEDESVLELQAGESTFVDDSGQVAGVSGARYGLYNALIGGLAITPTFTPSPSPTATATPTSTPTTPQWPIIEVIGQSVNNQPIEAVRFGDGPNVIIFIGGLHAGLAPGTVTLAEEIIQYFTEHPEEVPASITLFIIPSANPDSPPTVGEREGRYNANGVDLNRNWDCRHTPDPIIGGKVEPGRGGAEPFSEPEVKALRDFILNNNPAAVVFWMARARNGIISPGACAGESQVSNDLGQIYGEAANYGFVPDFEEVIDFELNGDAMNWLDERGIPAIAVLLRDYVESDFQRNLAGVQAVLESGLPPPPSTPSPDEIVFQSNRDGDFEIYIMSIDGSNQRQLTFNEADDNFPRVSADGRKIVFESERDGNPEIYVMDRDGSNQQRLTSDPANDGLPAWSPDGQHIIFFSARGGGELELYIMSAQGNDLQRITFTDAIEGHSAWSVNDQLVFNVSQPDQSYWQIYTMDIDGGNRQRLTTSQVDEWSPEWSPDGQQILFLSERDSTGNAGIYVMNADGSDAHLIYNDPLFEWGPSWSADGTQILFTVDQPDDTADIFIMNADGSDVRLLAERGGYPSWAAATVKPPRTLSGSPIATNEVTAPQVLSPPTIDGMLTEWTDVPAYALTHRVHSSDDWDGSEDLTAVCQLTWDANNLYLSIAVTDDRHVQTQSGPQIFRGDSVELQLDTDLMGDFADSLSPDDFQIVLSPGNFANLPPSAVIIRGDNTGQALIHNIRLAAVQTTTGYEMEAAISWQDLGVTPAPNLEMGLALSANDNDVRGTAVQEVMLSNAPNRIWTDPTSWGTLTLTLAQE